MAVTNYVDFVAGTTTDNPLGAGATTFNSANLSSLPAVAAGTIIKICFNPTSVGSAAEIAYVTAHTGGTDVATILRGQEGTTGTAWPVGTTWTVVLTATDIDDLKTLGASPGDIKSGVWAAAPTGWLLMTGQTLAGAQTNYPDLWAAAPVAWRSGVDLILPDMTEDRTALGGGTLGAEGGSNTHTLTLGNLPPHDHTFSDTSTSALTTHTHTFNDGGHTHGVGTLDTALDGAHTHNLEYIEDTGGAAGGRWYAVRTADVGTPNAGTSTAATHNHALSGATASATASGTTAASASLAHTHDISGTTGSTGSGSAVTHTPAHLRVNWAIKT